MIDCRETLKRFYDYLDSELPDLQCREVEEHLAACRPCLDRMEFEKHFARFVRREGQVEVDTRELKLRLLEKIRSLDAAAAPPATRVPAWSYALVGVALLLLLIPFWKGTPDRTPDRTAWPAALNPLTTLHAAFDPQYRHAEADSLVRWLSQKAPFQPMVYEFAGAGCALSGASVDSVWAVVFAELGGYPVTIFEASQADFAIPAGLREVSLEGRSFHVAEADHLACVLWEDQPDGLVCAAISKAASDTLMRMVLMAEANRQAPMK